MFRKGLLLSVIFFLIFGMSGFAAYYEYTQQGGTNFFVSAANKSDALEDTNEVRQILDDLGNLLGHSLRDGSYPKDLTTGGTLSIEAITIDIDHTNTLAAGLKTFSLDVIQGTNALTGTLRGAYITASNYNVEATGTIRGLEVKARTEQPGGSGATVAVLEGISVGADSKDHSVGIMRGMEVILAGTTGGTVTEGVGIRIANNMQADKTTTMTALQIYSDSFPFDYGIDMSQGAGGISVDIKLSKGATISNAIANEMTLTASSGVNISAGLNLVNELDMTGASAIIDLNPAQTGTVQVINITPTAILTANETEWDGISINGNTLQPSGSDIIVHGIHLDFSTFSPTATGVHVDGYKVEMPDITEHGLHIIDGKIIIQGDIPSTAIAQFTGIDFIYSVDNMVETSMLHAIDVAIAEGEPAGDIVAVGTHTHVDVIHQSIGTFSTPEQSAPDSFAGIDDGGVYTAGLDTVEMFVANGDGFWLGDVAKFDEIEVDMSSDATKDIEPTFWYWKSLATDAWVEFEPADDTEGFQHSGLIRFDSDDLIDWLSADKAGAEGAEGYWIKVVRTAVVDPGTPTADTIKINSITLYSWDKDGDLVIKDIDAASLILDTALAIAEGGTGVSTGAMVNFTSILNAALYIGRDSDNQISWATDDRLKIKIGGTEHTIASIVDGAGDSDILVTKGYVDDVAGGYTNLTQFVNQTAWRVFYSNTNGDVVELALGADGSYLMSNGAAVAPSFETPAGGGDMLKATYDIDEDGDIDVAAGGTEKSSWTQYAIPYLSNTTIFGEIPVGTAEYALTVAAGATGYDWTLLMGEVVDDTTPELGGTLDHNNERATEVKTIEFNGIYAIGNSGATETVDWQNGAYQSITLDEACVISFSNEYVGTLNLIVTYAGSFALTFGGMTLLEEGGVEIITTDATGVDFLMFKNLGTADTYLMGALLDFKD